ncbi:glycoside hydrolase family 2 TIM barrel-domain containing protein [uncultured Algibacter sp.]|uniref:glycoside hydrolase family 2 TIM barrel-domain containing protein n=1 Tax=uncultured Algibacter sp. TaxID=298659 RepID=UPI0026165373|nr:glycoside hydrolase family 2 TIM barrel-domain containing protein [uncultured Algibacter sp.]
MAKYVITLIVICFCLSCKKDKQNSPVPHSERHIYVNNKPYTIKGICYHPVPKGSVKRDFTTIAQDLALMQEAGINTIRVYAPIDDITVLDKIHEAGIKIIIGFGFDQNGVYDIKSGTCIDYVNKYKNHPSILMWELGNEYNYHPEWFEGDIKNWYSSMNSTANLIHQIDNAHPVTTAHGELPDQLALTSCPNIDVWGMNVYRWDNPEPIFKQWKAISTKPMYISEAGGDSYMTIAKEGFEKGENEKAQAAANAKILTKIFENQEICLGVTMFSFTDGWWKAGNPNKQDIGGWAPNSSGVPYDGSPNEEFWGIVDIDRNKKETFSIIKTKYN